MNGRSVWEREIFWYVLIGIIAILIFSFLLLRKPKPVCGNGVCEPFESPENCCIDCGCPNGYECKENKCVAKEVRKGRCGDGKCEKNENCWDCPQDCKCGENEYCSEKLKKCVKPVCGNGVCEPFESPENCCIDCGCTIPGQICDPKTFKCKMKEVNISDERVIELVKNYLLERNEKIKSINVVGVFKCNDKIGKRVKVEVEEGFFMEFLVTEDEEIIELPVI